MHSGVGVLKAGLAALAVAVAVLAVPAAEAQGAGVEVRALETEHAVDPLGVDAQRPRLSWQLRSHRSDVRQTGYRILVASSPERLRRDEGDVWDSGRVQSDRSIEVPYGGPPLQSRRRYHWKARAYDEHGQATEWSRPASWEMGLLQPADWSARWIGMPAVEQDRPGFEGAKWVWHDEPGGPFFPAGARSFRRTFDLPADRRITKAQVVVTGDDEFELFVNGTSRASSVWWYEPRAVDVTDDLHAGRNALAIAVTNRGREAGMVALLRVEFETGDSMAIATDGTWRSSADAPAAWTEPGFDDAAWTPVRIIAAKTLPLASETAPAPSARRTFPRR